MRLRRFLVITGAFVLAGYPLNAQQTATAATQDQSTAQPAPAGLKVRPEVAAEKTKEKKGKKEPYTGPTEIVELPPTPMLDEEGKQRLDPDGKPMWNAAIKQQRDKKGHPLFDESGKPVFQTASELGYDEHGKKLHVKKEKPPKMIPVSIARGTLTVDGMTGKAALNYDIADFKYMYLYAPAIGVAVVSSQPFAGATEEKNAFVENTLTVNVGEHTLQLASENRLLGKKAESAYVLMDRQFTLPSRFPVMGYGTVRKAPYTWPGAKPNERIAGLEDAPPTPADLLPVQLLSPCPAGQMRKPAPPVLPGQAAPPRPCVPIKSATAQTARVNESAGTVVQASKN